MKRSISTALPPFSAVAWTVAAFVTAAAPHLLAMPVWLAAAVLVVCAWRLAAARYRWSRPPTLLRLSIAGIGIALVVFAFGGLWGRRAATALLCVMLAAKMMEMFTMRDLRLVASVCFFLIATQFLFNERLVYLVYLVFGSLLATIALYRIQDMQDGTVRTESAHDLASARSGAMLLLMAVPVALTLFVLFPRLAQPLWGLPDQIMDGRTGLSDEMSPGSISNLFLDDSPAFRAEFEGPPPPPEQRYWRGPVLWNFNGTTWSRPFFGDTQRQFLVPEGPRRLSYRVQLEPHERRWLFVLDFPVSGPDQATLTMDHQLLNRHPVTTLMQYEVVSNPDFMDMPGLPEGLRSMATRLPGERNPRTLALAAELRERYSDDRELIQSVLTWFREENFYYSLRPSPLGRHGVDEFLFDLRSGFCEHYASAFAVLMRAAGIPTRVVTGYQGGFWQTSSAYLLVRQSDAHAWTEVWLDGSGWTRVDPTAAVSPARIEQGARSAISEARHLLDRDWIKNLRNRYDRVQHLWNRWVLGFDHDRQRRMLDRLGLPDMSVERIALLMMAVLTLVSGLLAWLLLRPTRPAARTAVDRAWQRLLRRLRRRGLVKQVHETPLEFAARVQAALPETGSEFVRLAEAYCRLHYGNLSGEEPGFLAAARTFSPAHA